MNDREILIEIRDKQAEMAMQIALIAQQQSHRDEDLSRVFAQQEKHEARMEKFDGRVQVLERAETLNERVRTGVWAGVGMLCLAALGIVSMAWDSHRMMREESAQEVRVANR